MLIAVILALPYGPRGVAAAYSMVMMIKVIPVTIWALRGTGVRVREIVMALARPMVASLIAAGVAFAAHAFYAPVLAPVVRLAFDMALFGAVYLLALFLIGGKQALYLDLLGAARTTPSIKATA
jgi:hypothetical protein